MKTIDYNKAAEKLEAYAWVFWNINENENRKVDAETANEMNGFFLRILDTYTK